jgi:ABC-type polar amino acid transport system ATPase subunit
MLSCRNLRKEFSDRAVLESCSVEVRKGECVIIRGRSGGGKSTLLRCLALLLTPDAGAIVHGDRVHTFPDPDANPRSNVRSDSTVYPFLTLVFQQIYLWPNLTIQENIAMVVEGHRSSSLRSECKALLARLHVDEVLHKRPAQCSLGQRQRVAVARAVQSDARFLLLDEPTSALDRRNRAELVAVLAEAKTEGRGLLVVSHDERDFESVATCAFELDSGVLVKL